MNIVVSTHLWEKKKKKKKLYFITNSSFVTFLYKLKTFNYVDIAITFGVAVASFRGHNRHGSISLSLQK